MSSQLRSNIYAYLLEALNCKPLELLLKDNPQVIVCEVLCLIYYYFYNLF